MWAWYNGPDGTAADHLPTRPAARDALESDNSGGIGSAMLPPAEAPDGRATPIARREPSLRPVLAFFALAVALSWALWIPTIASQRGWIAARVPVMPWGSFGPALAALAVAWRLGEARALLRSLVRFRAPAADYLIALLGPSLVIVVAAALALLWAGTAPRFAHLERLWLAPLLWLLILVVGGPLGEEVGWRGFALPRLLPRTGPLGASAWIAAMWLVWHLPLFWLEGAAQSGGSVALFAVMVAASAVLFTWFWMRTGGNLWLAVLLHNGINFPSFGLELVVPGLAEARAMTPLLCLAAVAVAAAAARPWLRAPSPPPGDRPA